MISLLHPLTFSWKSNLNAVSSHAFSRFIHESQLNALRVVFMWTNTHEKKNQFHYLDRCVFVSIWENIHPGWYKYSATLLKTSVRHCKTYNYSISNDLYMCLPSHFIYTLWNRNKLISEISVISVKKLFISNAFFLVHQP